MPAELLNQYTEICRVAIKSSSAKLGKTFENLLMEIILLNMAVQRKIKVHSNEAVQYALPAKAQESTGLLLQRLFASQNVAKVMMKEKGLPIFMASFKEIMAITYIKKINFDRFLSIPNRKLIDHTIKEFCGWQRKAVLSLSQI